ncbi:MAG: hypothetical protein ACRCZF_15165, partial [Gemmataceae bacterium]
LNTNQSQSTSHIVVLDDSPSMSDSWRGEDGQKTDSMTAALKILTEQIAPSAAQATTPQTLDLIRLSELSTPRGFGRLNTATIEEMKTYLNGARPTLVRGSTVAALKKARELVSTGSTTEARLVVHVLSDFRSADWATDGPAIQAEIDAMNAGQAKVHLVDVAHPFRKDDKRPPLFHDNVSVVEFRPTKNIVARFESAEFQLRVRNQGSTELKDVRLAVSVNGDDNKGLSVNIPTLPANDERTMKFSLTLDRVASADRPLDRFSLISARLETPEPGGITADNVRHTVVEVRDRLPIFVVEGRPSLRGKKEGDGFYLEKMFSSVLGGFDWKSVTLAELEKADLKQASLVLLLNVPSVPEPLAKQLDQYVRDGGGIGFFLGPDVKPADYNKNLFLDGKGLFPVPLPEKPSEPLTDEVKLQRLFTLQKKLLLRDRTAKSHPALANIYFDERGNALREDEFEKFFSFVIVGQYWPVKRLGAWREDPNITELYCMPNEQPMGEAETAVRPVIDRLPVDEPKFAKYKDALAPLKTEIRKIAASTEPLYKLANALDRLLSDQRTEGDATEALLREFWNLPDMADLKQTMLRLRDAVKYGDPLYLAKKHGQGRVTVVLTTAGETWTDWPTGPGRPSFVPIITEMERYLAGGGTEDRYRTGEPISATVEALRYKPTIQRYLMTIDTDKTTGRANSEVVPVDLKDQPLTTIGENFQLNFTETNRPGAYLFQWTKFRAAGANPAEAAEQPEYTAVAVNVDAVREGNLARALRDDILQFAPKAGLHSPEDSSWLDELKNKKSDLSESGWLCAILFLILLLEQWLAVRLSFHLAPNMVPESNRSPSSRAAAPAPSSAALDFDPATVA